MLYQEDKNKFIDALNIIATDINKTAHDKGWYDKPREDGTIIALITSELSEALEYLRHDNPPSDHIPEFSGLEEEFADVLIRILDTAKEKKLRLPEALLAKMKFNESRSHKHGGKKF